MTEHIKQPIVKAFGTKWNSSYSATHKLSIFLGLLGADRFYVGDIWLGIFKLLLTLSVQGIPVSATWWIIDIFIIRSHRADWNEWIGAKQAKRDEKKRNKEYRKKAAIEGKELIEERKKSGKCTSCGSDRLQAVAETTSRAQMSDAIANIIPRGNTSLAQKVQSKTVLVCLNCGFKRTI